MKENVWRTIAIAALSAIGGLVSGQFIPNRNIVTNDQLISAVAPIQASQLEQTKQIDALKDQVSELRGELKGKKMLDQ